MHEIRLLMEMPSERSSFTYKAMPKLVCASNRGRDTESQWEGKNRVQLHKHTTAQTRYTVEVHPGCSPFSGRVPCRRPEGCSGWPIEGTHGEQKWGLWPQCKEWLQG